MERRRHDRHDVHLPVQLEWGEGLTRDMSVSGAYIETPSFDVPVGQTFNFSVTVGQPDDGNWTLKCQGLVIRIDRKGDKLGIAVSIDRFLEISSNMSGIEQEH
jgi:hypothetical protein